ncbi:MAG: hypothetical protein WDN45_01005 [Caulobacteraceae bacterium]
MAGNKTSQPIAFVNARLIDPEARYDGVGSLVVQGGTIADLVKNPPSANSRTTSA